jgi:hypothetical protein
MFYTGEMKYTQKKLTEEYKRFSLVIVNSKGIIEEIFFDSH